MDSFGKISVVVPIYNGEEFLRECINSILRQSYNDIEVILVDDGSTDNTLEICQEFKRQDSRVVVVSQANQGVSSARNSGIVKATGKYVTFVDSDDRLLSDTFEIALKYLIDTSADVVTYGWKRVSIDGDLSEIKEEYEVLEDKETIIQRILEHYSSCGGGYPWNKLWRVDVFQDRKMPKFSQELFYFEDLEWVIKTILCINKMVICPQCLYLYTIREDSVTNVQDVNESREISYHKAIQSIISCLSSYQKLEKWFRERYYIELINGVIGAKQRKQETLKDFLMKYVKKEKHRIIHSKELGINLKCRLLYILLFA